METDEPAWTKEHLQRLLTAMKSNIPEHERRVKYDRSLKTLDWVKVAFEPFTPEECKQKWGEILDKMRKIRSLTELIDEAEDVIANPVKNWKAHPELPKRPRPPNCQYFKENYAKLHKQHPEMNPSMLLKFALDKFQTLSDKEKAPYVTKFNQASEEYAIKMKQFRKDYNLKPRTYHKEKKVSADTTDGEDCNSQADTKPIRPPITAYNLFCKEQQACMTGAEARNYMSVWAKRWKNLSQAEKVQYTKRCFQMKKEYEVKLKEYAEGFDKKKQQRILSAYTISERRRKMPCEPKMPPLSGTEAYIQEQMEVLKAKIPNSNRRLLVIKKQWQRLSMIEKEHYKGKVITDKDQYSARLQRWFKMLNSEEQKNYRKDNPDKCQYLQTEPINGCDIEEESILVPSDSEDEVLEDSSSEEETNYVDLNEDDGEEEEEEDDDIISDVY